MTDSSPHRGGRGGVVVNLAQLNDASRLVDWYRVYTFVAPLIEQLGPLSWPGSPSWCELSDHDPRKLAAVLVAGVLWSLNQDARQNASNQASRAIAASADWGAISRRMRQHADFYRTRPWLRRHE